MTENQEKTVPKRTKKFIKRGISVILMIGVLVAAMLEVLTLTEYRPPERERVAILCPAPVERAHGTLEDTLGRMRV